MSKALVLSIVLVCATFGCSQERPPRTGEVTTQATHQPKSETSRSETQSPNLYDPIDYSEWKPLTEQPKRIPLGEFLLCLVSPGVEKRRTNLGLHYVAMVKLFANPVAADNIEQRNEKPLPNGAIIVKEKWLEEQIPNQHDNKIDESGAGAYAAMIKREPGYDPEHGDWEYIYVTRKPNVAVHRGQLQNCRNCHSKARNTDYLFLPDPKSDNYPDE